MTDGQKSEEIAVERHRIITPIMVAMEEKTDAAKLVLLKKEVCRQNGIHRKTLGRWLDAYQERGFEGLKPIERGKSGPSVITEEVLTEAVLLRREVPSRSIPQIIEILEMEGHVPVGVLKRTTCRTSCRHGATHRVR